MKARVATATGTRDPFDMTDTLSWLPQLRAMIERQATDDDPTEQLSLAVSDLFATVPDAEICEAYLNTDGEADDPVADALAAECERRNLDF